MCSLDYDEAYLPHYIDYYDKQGIDRHAIILHSSQPIAEEIYLEKYYGRYANVDLFFLCGDWNPGIQERVTQETLDKLNLSDDDWVINLDVDEFVEAEGKTLREKISEMERRGENCCVGAMVDRVAPEGFPALLPDKPLHEQFPNIATITKDIGGSTRKVPITRATLRVLGGHHHLTVSCREHAVVNSELLTVNHYKWTQTTIAKLRERVITNRKYPYWKESQRFLDSIDWEK